VRIHTVIGGNVAPAATANVSSQPDPGVVAVHGRHEGCKRSGKSERAKREQKPRAATIDNPAKDRRNDRQPGDISGGRRSGNGK